LLHQFADRIPSALPVLVSCATFPRETKQQIGHSIDILWSFDDHRPAPDDVDPPRQTPQFGAQWPHPWSKLRDGRPSDDHEQKSESECPFISFAEIAFYSKTNAESPEFMPLCCIGHAIQPNDFLWRRKIFKWRFSPLLKIPRIYSFSLDACGLEISETILHFSVRIIGSEGNTATGFLQYIFGKIPNQYSSKSMISAKVNRRRLNRRDKNPKAGEL
jgi:hypothetical protein